MLVLTILGFSVQVALVTGMFSFAGVGCFAIGGYTAALLVIHGVPVLAAIAAALALSAVVGIVLAFVLGRLGAIYMAMASFAFVMIVQTVVRSWESLTGGAVGLFGVPVAVSTTGVLLAAGVCAVAVHLTQRGRSGRTLIALQNDPMLAASLGTDVVRMRVLAFLASGVLGGLSGAMSALLFNTLNPEQAGFSLIVDALTIVVIGGIGAWYGPLAGAIVVVWLPEILRFAGDWRSLVQGVIIVVMVIYAPEGAVGIARAIRGRLPRGPLSLRRYRAARVPIIADEETQRT
jgi:branched-chain amino acid transport system permease protein